VPEAPKADKPKDVLFVCVHNSGRSRMAEAFFNDEMMRRGITEFRAQSAGTAPSDSANPSVMAVMAEIGLNIPNTPGRLLTPNLTDGAVKFVSMGCGDAETCPVRLRQDMEDWELDDPKGKTIENVRHIRAAVKARVDSLIDDMFGRKEV